MKAQIIGLVIFSMSIGIAFGFFVLRVKHVCECPTQSLTIQPCIDWTEPQVFPDIIYGGSIEILVDSSGVTTMADSATRREMEEIQKRYKERHQ